MGLILGAEDSATDYATNTTSTDEGSRAESALPLATDVVGLPGKNAGNICVCGSGCEEDAWKTELADVCDAIRFGSRGKRTKIPNAGIA